MKKFIQYFVLICTILCTLSYNAFAESRFKTSKELQIYMRRNFYYTEDKIPRDYFEFIQSPVALELSRMGDCDDFATYSWYYLRQMNIKALRYALWMEQGGHVVTVFLDNDGTYSIFSNYFLAKTDKTTAKEAIKDIYPKWLILCEWNPTKYGLVTREEFRDTLYNHEFVNLVAKLVFLKVFYLNGVENVNY